MMKKLNLKKGKITLPKKEKKTDGAEYGPIVVEVLEKEKKDETPNSHYISFGEGSEKPNYSFEFNRKYFMICIYALVTIAIGAVIIYCIMNLPSLKSSIMGFFRILSPFITAFFIAFIINPLVHTVESKFFLKTCKIKSVKIRLSLAILVSYIAVLSIIAVGLNYVIPQITSSISDLSLRLPGIYEQSILWLDNIEKYMAPEVIQFIEEKLGEITPQLVAFGSDLVKNVFPVLIDLPVFLAKLAINLLLSIAISIYMLYDKRMLTKHAARVIYAIIPKQKADSFLEVAKNCSSIFTSFVVGKSIDSLIIGIICFFLMLILKLPYAVLLSAIVGITNMIPYFGPFIGAVPGVVLFLCFSPLNAVIFALMIFVLQQFDGWILGPKILGDSTGLTPLWVIFGITVGGAYAGVLGMFLGVPIVAVVAYLANLFISAKLKKKRIEIK